MLIDSLREEECLIELLVPEGNNKGVDAELRSFIYDGITHFFVDGLEVNKLFFRRDNHTAIKQNHRGIQMQSLEECMCLAEASGCSDREDSFPAFPVPDTFAIGTDCLVAAQKCMIKIG